MQVKFLVRMPDKMKYPLPVLQLFVRMMDNEKEIKHLYVSMNEYHLKNFFYGLGFETMRWALVRYPEPEAKSAIQELVWELQKGAEEQYNLWLRKKEEEKNG